MNRRAFLAGLSAPAILRAANPTDIRIASVQPSFEDFLYRTPYKFGGREVDRVTLLNVRCRVESRTGRSAEGFGSMTLGNVWAWPSPTLTYDQTLGAMKDLALRIGHLTAGHREY